MDTVLVTGGAGFIGSCLVRRLVTGCRVITLDALTYAGDRQALPAEGERHVFVRGEIGDRGLLQELFDRYRPRAILHLAAESHVDRSIATPADFVRTNTVGTAELLEATRAHWQTLPQPQQLRFRFLHVSTDEVYGSLGPRGAFTETSPYAPNSPYSASKAAADHFVRAYHHTYGLPVLTTHCSNNYGPWQSPEKLIPLTIQRVLAGQPIPLYGDGLNVRDWLYVEDHVEALLRVLESGRPGHVYNIGGDCQRTNREVVESVCAVLDRLCDELPLRPCQQLISYVADRPGHDRRYAIDGSKLRRELDWQPQWKFAQGIERTVRWYLDHRDWMLAAQRRLHEARRPG